MRQFNDFIKDYIDSKLDDIVGQEVYVCEFASTLCEGDNRDGVIWFEGHEWCANAKKWLQDNEYELRAAHGYWESNYGESNLLEDYFEAECRCMFKVVFTYVDSGLGQYLGKRKDWNDQKVISQRFVNKIRKDLDKIVDLAVCDLDYYFSHSAA